MSDDLRIGDDLAAENDAFLALIRSAGRRPEPPERMRQQALEVAFDAWRDKITRVRRRRTVSRFAAGLVAVAGVGGLAMLALAPRSALDVPAVPVAQLERSIGTVEIRLPGEDAWRLVHDEISLVAGSRLRTGPGGGAGVRLAGGASLRLAPGTEMTFAKAPLLELVGGRAYVDSGGRDRSARVEIVSSIASVTDVGTQFEVSLVADRYRVRVREGAVLLRHGTSRIHGDAGNQLTIGPDGALERATVPLAGGEWGWVEALATAPEVNDRPVTELLQWVARETGREIRFKDAAIERRAASTILHGSIRHLAPLDALNVMLATTDLDYIELDDGTLLIQSRPLR